MKNALIREFINNELVRQENNIELIASENYVSLDVLEACGSILTNKYAEGYPGRRYYGGCENVDMVEREAQNLAKQLFNVKYANVQPHSGSQANMAAYRSILNKGDKILSMSLSNGGHLTHGHKLSFSGSDYVFVHYDVDENGLIDYEAMRELAIKEKPQLILAGASAYSRIIDFAYFKKVADEVGAYFMVDMAHIAGLVATGLHPNPCEYADIVTTTTHKTLRGPRGGMILTNNEEIYKKINSTLFPGIQGGPLMHIIAAKAVCFAEDLEPSFKKYCEQIITNCKALAEALKNRGYKLITGGTDNHLMLVDTYTTKGLTGKEVEKLLDKVGITVNKNTIPNDQLPPMITSGIRIGTAAITTRGFVESDMELVAQYIDEAISNKDDEAKLAEIHSKVIALTSRYPLPYKKL